MRYCAAVGVLVLTTFVAAGQQPNASFESLVGAERAFSQLSVKIGQLPAFLAYFADDVVTFQPMPGKGKAAMRERAASMRNPPAYVLDWEPWVADISATGDLGYTSGPVLISETEGGKSPRHGWYFSVWKRDDYGWRVAADIGISSPPAGPLRPRTVVAPPQSPASALGAKEDVLAVERRASERAAASGFAAGYEGRLAPSVRLYRDGQPPLQGVEEALAYFNRQPKPLGWQPLEAVTSRANDLAYVYGLFDVRPGDAPSTAKAAFLHVWKRGSAGWLLAADIVNP